MARTPTGSIDKSMLSKVANFDFQKNSATLDNVVSIGGFRDKFYNLYVVENKMQGSRSLDTDYLFTRVPYKPKYILQERDPVNDEKYYYILEKNNNSYEIGDELINKSENKIFTSTKSNTPCTHCKQ
jgi:hypothetical protein